MAGKKPLPKVKDIRPSVTRGKSHVQRSPDTDENRYIDWFYSMSPTEQEDLLIASLPDYTPKIKEIWNKYPNSTSQEFRHAIWLWFNNNLNYTERLAFIIWLFTIVDLTVQSNVGIRRWTERSED